MKNSLSRLTLAIMAACCALPALAQQDNTTGTQIGDNAEVIEVRGIRGSLTQALATKRMSDSVLDSISAEDIGDFPDKNIGDALQRIPGVSVSRGFGEVDGVNIRGTAPEHSLFLLNGQNVATVGWFDNDPFNRSFNFELVSAEQVAGLDVYKSVEANNNEGALGGTINVKTRKPLEMDAMTFVGSIEASNNSNADGWEPGISGLFSWKDEAQRFGVLVAHSIEKLDVVRETQSTFGGAQSWNIPGIIEIPDTDGTFPVTPLGFASILFDEQRERESSQLTFEFQATENLSFSSNYHRFSLENKHVNTALFNFFFLNGVIDADSALVNNQGVTVAGRANAITQDSDVVPIFNNTVVRAPKMLSDVLNLNMNYVRDDWELSALVGRSTAESRGLQSSTWWADLDNKLNAGLSYDISDIHKFVPDNPEVLLDHSKMKLHREFSYLNNVRDNNIDYYQLDTKFQLNAGIFTRLDAGLKYQEQAFSASQHYFDGGLLQKGIDAGLSMDNFNGGSTSGILGEVASADTLNTFALINNSVLDFAEQNKGTTQIRNMFKIAEDITSAYVKGNFSGDNYRGNLGLRFVDTDVLSSSTSDGTPSGDPLRQAKSYSNLLPSVNLVVDLRDDLLLRFAAGKTVSRPQYEQMKMASSIQVNQKLAQIGSPDIDPYKSDQYDLGLEWYFNQSSVLGATVFIKNISDYIEQTQQLESISGCDGCLVTRYRNAGDAEVQGIELQYQQDFGNGFGVQANYTYTDSEIQSANGTTNMFAGVSENSYNLSAYYENEVLSTRIAYNGRDEWQQLYNGITGTADPYKQVDASIVWHITDNIDVSFEAINIFNEVRIIRLPELGYLHGVDEFGTRYYVGASFRM